MHADAFLYTGQQARELDARAIAELGVSGIQLMKQAGRAAFDLLNRRHPGASRLGIVCGSGNNAGDGYIVAGLALQQRYSVSLIQLGDAQKLSGDAARARDWALDCGVEIHPFEEASFVAHLKTCEVIVDALLGTGLKGEVREDYHQCIQALNADPRPVMAIDLPSGLDPDTGCARGVAVCADSTISFIVPKRGLYTCDGPACAGEIFIDTLNVPNSLSADCPAIEALSWSQMAAHVPRREVRANSNKKNYGHVLVVGGNHAMGGAVCMGAQAALRCGAGMVSVLTRPENVSSVLIRQPEVMVLGTDDIEHPNVNKLLQRASVIVVGPGLGSDSWAQSLLRLALDAQKCTLLDADALNLLADNLQLADRLKQVPQTILTPHPGEAARLLHSTVPEVQEDRFAAVAELGQKYQAAVVLKGTGSLVGGPHGTHIGLCLHGSSAMATAGMGDMLSGVIGALLAQGMPAVDAARAGTCLHSAAADLACEQEGRQGLVATDLLACLRELLNP